MKAAGAEQAWIGRAAACSHRPAVPGGPRHLPASTHLPWHAAYAAHPARGTVRSRLRHRPGHGQDGGRDIVLSAGATLP